MIRVLRADITTLSVDAIVNAANSMLTDGAGVNGAIQRAAGPGVLRECQLWIREHGECMPGEAVLTSSGKLNCRFIIHAVGPIWNGGKEDEDQILGKAYESSLELATLHGIRTIAFPNISTGIYGFPKQRAAEIAIKTVKKFIAKEDKVTDVIFCCFDDENYSIYSKLV